MIADVANQPADISFVIDQLLKQNRTKGSRLFHRIDPKHIGLGGLSLGGWTTYGVAFNTCCRDPRVKAVELFSAILGGFAGGTYDFTTPVPALLVHGDADPIYSQSVSSYPMLGPPKWFVTLHGSTHAPPFEDTPDPNDDVVRAVTVDFWDRELKGDRHAAKRLADAVARSQGRATLQHEA